MNEISNIINQQEHEFAEVISIIQQHRSVVSRLVNEELLLTARHVGSNIIVQLHGQFKGLGGEGSSSHSNNRMTKAFIDMKISDALNPGIKVEIIENT